MNQKERAEILAHHSMAITGGFFGVYALLLRNETFGSSETSNLILLAVAGMDGSLFSTLVRIGSVLCYIVGIVFATLVPKWCRIDFRYIAIGIDAAACVALAQIPAEANSILALYPMLFATAVQWLAFLSAAGFNSATIFSTNNLRQCVAGLTEYLHGRKEKHRKQFWFYFTVLLFFHSGVIYAWFCMRLWRLRSIYACLLPLAFSAWATARERKISALFAEIPIS